MTLAGKTAVVTGGSRGIGRAVVNELRALGANVVFSYAGNADAAEAITALDGKEFDGRALRINKAEPKKPAARRW